MEGIEMKVEGTKLVLTIDLTRPGRPRSTGKTMLIATSAGAASIDYAKRPGVKVAVNVTAPK